MQGKKDDTIAHDSCERVRLIRPFWKKEKKKKTILAGSTGTLGWTSQTVFMIDVLLRIWVHIYINKHIWVEDQTNNQKEIV